MDNKQNDWILLSVQNPNLTLDQFADNGINTNNTSIYDREKYLNSTLIQGMEQFQTDGKFDKVKFNNFYDTAIQNYNDLSTQTYSQRAMETAQFSYNNLAVSKDKRTKDLGWSIIKIQNPDRRNFGIEQLGFISNPKFTPQEIAQNEKIWNNKTQKWEDSPNDSWLFRNWAEPTAMATWDFNADANGNPTNDENATVYHKGEYKINPETGTYYYETLNGKSPYGKELLTPFDIITKDGSKANDYDFFDSDGLNKSITGSIMKTTARIAPMFIPYVGPVYIAANIGLELAKVLPIVYKSTFGLADGDHSFANKIEGIAMSFDNNKVSKEGSQSFFNSEQILNMIGDVAKQLYEQRWIFTKAPRLFKPYGIEKGGTLEKAISEKAATYFNEGLEAEAAAKYARLGKSVEDLHAEAFAKASIWGAKYQKEFQDVGKIMSRLYMTGTSSYQAFSDAKEEGASDLEAAAMFWGYAAGMYWLMGTEVGEHILPELRMEKQQIRNILKSVAEGTQKEAKKGLDIAEQAAKEQLQQKNIFIRTFKKAAEVGKNTIKKATKPITEGGADLTKNFNSIWSNMLAEGVEEVSEEALYDATRATFDAIAALSGSSTRLSQWDTALQRYGQSFIGGMLGGGIFQASNDIQIRKRYDPGNVLVNQELIYYIRNGEKAEIKRQLTKLYQEGAFGDSNLSTKPLRIENGNIVYGEGTVDDNQNKAVYDLMNQYVDMIDEVLNTEKMNLPDAAIISNDGITGQEVLQEIRYQNIMRDLMVDPTSVGKMLQDYNSMAERFLQLHSELDQLNSVEDSERRNDPQWQLKVDDVNRRLTELRDERDKFFEPETQAKYLGLMMFSANNGFSAPFANTTYRDFVESNYHKPVEQLNDYEKQKSQEDYQDYLSFYASKYISKGYDVFINLLEKFSNTLQQMGEQQYKNYSDARRGMLNSTIEVTNPDGTIEHLSLMQLIPRFFGGAGTNDEKLQQIAEELKTRYNPFDEISNLLINAGNNPSALSESEIIPMLNTISNNLSQIIGQFGFIDSGTAKTVKKLMDLSISIPDAQFGALQNIAINALNNHPDINAVVQAIVALKQNLNPLTSSENLRQFQEAINNTSIDDQVKQDLITEATNRIAMNFTPDKVNVYTQLNDQLQNVADSPIAKFLADLKINENGLNIFDLINKAESIFKAKEVSEFVIDGEISIDDVKNARQIVKQMKAIVRAMMYENVGASLPYGFTSVLNQLRRKFGANELGMLDTADASLMLQDLATIDSKLRFIERLHSINQESSEREQNRLQTRLNYLAYELLDIENSPFWNNTDGSKKEINGEQILTQDIINIMENEMPMTHQMIDDQNSPLDVSDNERTQLEAERVKLENAIFDRFRDLYTRTNVDKKQLIRTLLDGLFTDLSDPNNINRNTEVSNNSQGITSNTTSFSVNDKISYLASILGIKSGDFIYKYKQVIEADQSNIAPIPMQELLVRLQYAGYNNRDFFNDLIDVIGDQLSTWGYDTPLLKNTVFAPGVPGAGKSSAVARLTYQMLVKDNPNIKTITNGPHLNQAQNLANSVEVNPSNNEIIDKDQLLAKCGTNTTDINQPLAITLTDDNGKLKFELLPTNYAAGDVPDALFIDEATHYTALELMKISEWCNDKGIFLFLFGDPDQSGQRNILPVTNPKTGQQGFNNSFSAVYCMTGPKLTISMRASTNVKRDNSTYTRNLASEFELNEFLAAAQRGEYASVQDLWDDIANKNKLILKGAIDDGAVHGELLVDSLTEQQVIDLISKLEQDEKVGFIYEDVNSPTYALMSRLSQDPRYIGQIELKSAIDFFTEGNAQGNENQFFIVDIDWSNKQQITGDDAEDFLNYKAFVKSLHTIVTRSKQGTYIINNGLDGLVGNDAFKIIPMAAVSKIQMNDQSLTNYKQRRIDTFNTILQGYTPTRPSGQPPANNSPSGPQPPNNPSPNGTQPPTPPTPPTPPPTPPTPPIPPTGNGPLQMTISNDTSFNVNSVDFGNELVAVYEIPSTHNGQPMVDVIQQQGNIKVTTKNKSKIKAINNPQELQNAINNIGKDKVLFIIEVPKSQTNKTTVVDFIANGQYIEGQYIKHAINKTQQQQQPPQGNQFNAKVGWVKNYNGELWKITEIGTDYYKIVNPKGDEQQVSKADFETHATDATKTEFDDAVAALQIGTNQPGGTTSNQQTTLQKRITRAANVVTLQLTDEELLKVVNNAKNGNLGFKLYTGFGFRTGVEFKRDGNGNLLKDTNGNYQYVDSDGTSDLALLLDIQPNTQGVVTELEYNEAVRTIYKIRSILQHESDFNELQRQVEKEINNFRTRSGRQPIQFKGQFKLKTIPNDIYSETLDYYPHARNKQAKQNKVIIYTNGTNEITLGTIAKPETVLKYVEQMKRQLTNLVNNNIISQQDMDITIQAWEDTIDLLAKINQGTSPGGSIQTYSLGNNFTFGEDSLLTNTKSVSITEEGNFAFKEDDRLIQDFDEIRNDPSAIYSDPHILTGIFTGGKHMSPNMNGKVFTFVTHDLNLRYMPSPNAMPTIITQRDGNKLAELWMIAWQDNIDQLYQNEPAYLKYLMEIREKIKPIKLGVKGNSFQEMIENQCAYRNARRNKDENAVASIGNINTGARLLELLLNMEADLMQYLRTGSSPNVNVGDGIDADILNFRTRDEVIAFEQNLRQLLWVTCKNVKFYQESYKLGSNLTKKQKTAERKKIIDRIKREISYKTGLQWSADYSTTAPTEADEQKVRNSFHQLFDLRENDPNLNKSWLKDGDYQQIGATYSYTIIDSITRFFTGDPRQKQFVWAVEDSKQAFLSELSSVISNYSNPNSPAKNNFTEGIYFTATYLNGKKGAARTATEMAYPANYVKGMFTVDVSVQSAESLVGGAAYQALAQQFANVQAPSIQQSVDFAVGNQVELYDKNGQFIDTCIIQDIKDGKWGQYYELKSMTDGTTITRIGVKTVKNDPSRLKLLQGNPQGSNPQGPTPLTQQEIDQYISDFVNNMENTANINLSNFESGIKHNITNIYYSKDDLERDIYNVIRQATKRERKNANDDWDNDRIPITHFRKKVVNGVTKYEILNVDDYVIETFKENKRVNINEDSFELSQNAGSDEIIGEFETVDGTKYTFHYNGENVQFNEIAPEENPPVQPDQIEGEAADQYVAGLKEKVQNYPGLVNLLEQSATDHSVIDDVVMAIQSFAMMDPELNEYVKKELEEQVGCQSKLAAILAAQSAF